MKNSSDAALTDIVTDSEKELETLMEKGFSALIDQNPDAFYGDAKDRLSKNLDEVGFYLDNNAVVFYLNSGIIAPESAGVIAFSVPPITDSFIKKTTKAEILIMPKDFGFLIICSVFF